MNNKGTKYGIILLLLILALTGANLLFGSVNIPADAVWHILTGNEVEKASWSFIVWESRLPQAITALLCGMALAASGLMLQTTFNNPLADPSILGISSGASLGVAWSCWQAQVRLLPEYSLYPDSCPSLSEHS